MCENTTIIDVLGAVSAYPIPLAALQSAAEGAGIYPDAVVTSEIRNSKEFKCALASVYEYLSMAPNISQGGVSFSFTSDERKTFARKASNLLAEAGKNDAGVYGWQGEDF